MVKTVAEPLQTPTGCVLHIENHILGSEYHRVDISQVPELFAVCSEYTVNEPIKQHFFSSIGHSGDEIAPFAPVVFKKKVCRSISPNVHFQDQRVGGTQKVLQG